MWHNYYIFYYINAKWFTGLEFYLTYYSYTFFPLIHHFFRIYNNHQGHSVFDIHVPLISILHLTHVFIEPHTGYKTKTDLIPSFTQPCKKQDFLLLDIMENLLSEVYTMVPVSHFIRNTLQLVILVRLLTDASQREETEPSEWENLSVELGLII